MEPKSFYTPVEVAAVLRVSSQTVLDWIHTDRLDAVQLSERLYRIPLGALLLKLGARPRIARQDHPGRQVDVASDARALAREHRGDEDGR